MFNSVPSAPSPASRRGVRAPGRCYRCHARSARKSTPTAQSLPGRAPAPPGAKLALDDDRAPAAAASAGRACSRLPTSATPSSNLRSPAARSAAIAAAARARPAAALAARRMGIYWNTGARASPRRGDRAERKTRYRIRLDKRQLAVDACARRCRDAPLRDSARARWRASAGARRLRRATISRSKAKRQEHARAAG